MEPSCVPRGWQEDDFPRRHGLVGPLAKPGLVPSSWGLCSTLIRRLLTQASGLCFTGCTARELLGGWQQARSQDAAERPAAAPFHRKANRGRDGGVGRAAIECGRERSGVGALRMQFATSRLPRRRLCERTV